MTLRIQEQVVNGYYRNNRRKWKQKFKIFKKIFFVILFSSGIFSCLSQAKEIKTRASSVEVHDDRGTLEETNLHL
jgi:hypothetical protein